jgi:type IV secretory pathway VirB2 component (pilin)
MKKFFQKSGSVLLSVFALCLLFGAVQFSLESGVAYANLISDADRPAVAFTSGFRETVLGVVNYILGFLGLISVIMIIVAGVKLVSGADEDGEAAKTTIKMAAAGAVLIFASYSIVNAIFAVRDTVV